MHPFFHRGLVWLVLAPVTGAWAALTPAQQSLLPPPANRPVDFIKDIQPLLQVSCAQCHGRGKDKGGFKIDTREDFLRGGDSGAAARPGDSAGSLVIELVSGLDPDSVMPKKGRRLTAEQVGLLRAWIDQGAPWPAHITFARQPLANLHPRRPDLPPATATSGPNPVDRFLEPYYRRHGVASAPPVEDRVFARRVYLDVLGLLPNPTELEVFVRDRNPGKREALVRRLLNDHHRYAEHWLSFWNDLLRNDYKGTGYIDGGRKPITRWLYSALATNMPYHQMVAQLVNPNPESEGFLKGIVWRGDINSSQTPAMQAAQNVAQVFLGVNLKCASCHDSFINDYTLAGTYALANVFSDQPLEIYECDKPTGRQAGMAFLYPEIGQLTPSTNRAERLRALAALITSERNGRLPRTVVNRLWARFFGHGLVEPVDEMDHPAWHPDLLDWLAEDLVAHGYDLKHLMFTLLTSRAYQRPAVSGTERREPEFVFRGPLMRRLTAEQFRDALAEVTGVGYAQPDTQVDWLLLEPPSVQEEQLRRVFAVQITNSVEAATNRWMTWMARELVLAAPPQQAVAVLAANQEFRLWINGHEIGNPRGAREPAIIDMAAHLRPGLNVLALRVGKKPDKPPGETVRALAASLRLRTEGWTWSVDADGQWRFLTTAEQEWKPLPPLAQWTPVPVEALTPRPGWLDARRFANALYSVDAWGRYRAAWVAADPLATSLNRPNREQVCTARPEQATTLQALELTNGQTLARLLNQGAGQLLSRLPRQPEPVARYIFQRALNRPPTRQELSLVRSFLGNTPSAQGVEDLLWAVAMLPEFQLIY